MKSQEVEDMRRKGRKRKDKIRAIKKENHALKLFVRDLEVKVGGGPTSDYDNRRIS